MNHCKHNRGFTLVELTRSAGYYWTDCRWRGCRELRLFVRAEIRAIISEVEDLRAAVPAFEAKFDKYPGDLHNALDYWPTDCTDTPSNPCNGNGVGTIGGVRFMNGGNHPESFSRVTTSLTCQILWR